MKIAVNRTFGGFSLPTLFTDVYGDFSSYLKRTDSVLINFINDCGGGEYKAEYTKVRVVTIPDNITDWQIFDYDGFETVAYVLDGKIYTI